MTSISVVIPAYINRPEQIVGLLQLITGLQHMASKTIPIQFIVQDDASPAMILPMVIPMCAASTVRNPENLGFAGNCNAGAARASGDILLFLNQDIAVWEASAGWDVAIANAFADTSIGVVGAKLLFPPDAHGQMGIQSAGGLYDSRLQPYHRWLGYTNHTHPDYNCSELVKWVTGAALAVRADVFREVGCFDEAYKGGYFEDVELCCRVSEAGYYVAYEPRCCFIHSVGSTGGTQYFGENMLLWKSRWVDSGKVTKDTEQVKINPMWW